jgi:ABC-2 type transport system permease protein
MATWTLARKEIRLLLRDYRALVILLAMPLIFIVVLGISVGEGFGQKPDNNLRVSVLNLDQGPPKDYGPVAAVRSAISWLALAPIGPGPVGPDLRCAGVTIQAGENWSRHEWSPSGHWADVVLKDLSETGGIRVEIIGSLQQAEQLVRNGDRAAVLVLGPNFSKRVSRSSFLGGGLQQTLSEACIWPSPGLPVAVAVRGLFDESQDIAPLYLYDGINPFYRDGVDLGKIDVTVLHDPTQPIASSIIEQVAQGTMLRVVLPWMIGRAFEKLGEEDFIAKLGKTMDVPVGGIPVKLEKVLKNSRERRMVGYGVQAAIRQQFSKYDLTAKTWAALTRSKEHEGEGAGTVKYREEGLGILHLGSQRYKVLVPSYTVMFSFFLVLTIGWLFVAERRQGTLKRLCAAPITRVEILLGKLAPCYLLSVGQGVLLLVAGRLIFRLSLGGEPLWLIPVVLSTSLAAMGMGVLVASVAKTEAQVAIYGSLLVLVLAGLSGCLMGNRALMPEAMQHISRITPLAWSLDAYLQLLANPSPEISIVFKACGVLVLFGLGFLVVAWRFMRLD